VRLEGLGQLKQIHLIGTGTRDFPACSVGKIKKNIDFILKIYEVISSETPATTYHTYQVQ
jgi:hypothetical protein